MRFGGDEINDAALDEAIDRFDAWSLCVLLYAAGSSYATRQRLPSIALLWRRAVEHPPCGSSEARVEDLPGLLAAARLAYPPLGQAEYTIPADPRAFVRQEVAGAALLVDPGLYRRPLATLRQMRDIAFAADDPVLREEFGFGAADAIEVSVRLMDWALDHFGRVWPRPSDAEDDAALTTTEVDVARECLESFDATAMTAQCADAERAAVMWRTAVADAARAVPFELDMPLLGAALGVEWTGRVVPVPAGLLMDGLVGVVDQLAARVREHPEARRVLDLVIHVRAYEVLRGLGKSGDDAAAPHDSADIGAVSAGIIARSHRHAVAFEVVSGFDAEMALTAIRDAARRLLTMPLDAIVAADTNVIGLAADAEVTPVVFYGGPIPLYVERRAGPIPIHLDEMRAMLARARTEEAGLPLLWDFLEDLATLPPTQRVPPLELPDLFAYWLHLGAFELEGRVLPVVITPFHDDPEWIQAAKFKEVDEVLVAAALPPVPVWDLVDEAIPGVVGLTHVAQRTTCLVIPKPPMVILSPISTPNSFPGGVDPSIGRGLAEAIAGTVASLDSTYFTRPDGLPVVWSLLVAAENGPDDEVAVRLGVGESPMRRVEVVFDLGYCAFLAHDPGHAHQLLASVLVEVKRLSIHGEAHDSDAPHDEDDQSFIAAWGSRPLPMRVQLDLDVLPLGDAPPDLLPRGKSSRARALRVIAAAIREAGVQPGTYDGERAKKCAAIASTRS